MNKNILSNILCFVGGAAVGSVVTWKLIEARYQQIAQEEIDAVREVYYREESVSAAVEESEDEEPDEDSRKEYKNIAEKENYFFDEDDEDEEEDEDVFVAPYVISPEEYDEIGYETVTLYYFEDGVLADRNNEVVDPDDIDDLVGENSLTTFGEYEDDSVFVRNENLRTDFEILKDGRRFSEVK